MSTMTVGQLNRYVRSLMEGDEILSGLSVSGEIVDFHRHFKTGHLYFTLRDEEASVKCVMFASAAVRLKFEPEDGMSVTLFGRASLYEKSGQYQLYAEQMLPDGEGMARLALQRLYEKLEKEGIFSPHRKLPLPKYPEKVAVLSSASGAALQDVRAVMGRRWPLAEILLFPVGVQGDRAAMDIVKAFSSIKKDTADLVILTRGGGSAEDLSVFNDELVVRAVAACPIPVIAAVGHEIDYTLAEMAASARAPTPSAAAELAVPDIRDVIQKITSLEQNVSKSCQRLLDLSQMRYELAVSTPAMRDPLVFIENKERILNEQSKRLFDFIRTILSQAEERFKNEAIRLDALSPLKTLSRGFCVATKDGVTVKKANQLQQNDPVSLTFEDGDVSCRVL